MRESNNVRWPLMKDTMTWGDRLALAKFSLMSNQFTQGPKVEEFEAAWSKWLGADHSLFVSSGSTANFLLIASAMEYYGLKPGDKVLLPACTWVTNINPIFQLGLTPIFCDINIIDFSFDLENFKHIAHHHPDIKIVFTTHLLGFAAPVHKYKEILPNAIFLDDVCESHGCKDIEGKKVGSDSLGATFSFYYGHHMSTIEGGMISTNNTRLYDLMKMKRSHGLARVSSKFKYYTSLYPNIEESFLFVSDGYNFRNTEMAAVLGLRQLKRLDDYITVRQSNHRLFTDMLKKYSNDFYPVQYGPNNSSFCFPLIARHRSIKNKLTEELKANSIEYRPIVGGNLLKQPYLKRRDYNISMPMSIDYPNVSCADIIHDNGIYIGNNQFVTSKDIELLDTVLGSI